MSNITEEIEKLSGIMSKLGEAHNMLAKTSLSKEEYQPISNLLASAKVELFKFCNDHKAALQNKVSDVNAEKIKQRILEAYYDGFNQAHYSHVHPEICEPKECESAGKEYMIKKEKLINSDLEEYASIVNEKKVSDVSVIVSDAEITKAWGYANFGSRSKRDVIIETLKKVAQGWGTGHTSICIVKELGLVENRNNQNGLSDKGLAYLLASVNKEDNIPADFKRVTGHDSPKEMMAYEKGREDEKKVISEWIEQWDGSSNSAMGTLLKKKFDERKDNAGINDAIEFADWINKNASRNAVGSWGYFGNIFYTKTSKELYDIFKSESQPQQKEV